MFIFMDWLFRLQIPKSTDKTLVISPLETTFINGISSKYREDQYDEAMLGKMGMDEKEFQYLMKTVNGVLKTYWPCSCTLWFGYLLSPITLGLSFYLPNLCISEAKLGLIAAIEK